MASPAQIAANRRNAKKSTGPRSEAGKAAVRFNALKSGLTAKSTLLPHECAADYHEIRASLMHDYAPASSQELMLVDQIACGYWRTIRARRFEVSMFDINLRARKEQLGTNENPNAAIDDKGCSVIMQCESENDFKNYFRYDASISRDYYRAINTLEKMQAARRREEDRQERKARQEAKELERIVNNPDPDTVAEISSEPPPPREAPPERRVLFVQRPEQHDENTPVDSTGFVSYYDRGTGLTPVTAASSAARPKAVAI